MADKGQVMWLGDLQRLVAHPGDVFVLKVKDRITLDQAERLRQMWDTHVGVGKCIVLDSGTELGLIGAAHADSITTGCATKASET